MVYLSLSTNSGRRYHLHCTGAALDIAHVHILARGIRILSFRQLHLSIQFVQIVQRVWVAFEYHGIPYRVRAVMVSFASIGS